MYMTIYLSFDFEGCGRKHRRRSAPLADSKDTSVRTVIGATFAVYVYVPQQISDVFRLVVCVCPPPQRTGLACLAVYVSVPPQRTELGSIFVLCATVSFHTVDVPSVRR